LKPILLKKMVLLVSISVWTCLSVSAETLEGIVLRVVDGDTLTIQVGNASHRIRLSEIDTPEMDQHWGDEAKAALVAKVNGAVIKVTVVDTDRYGRIVGKVWLDERDINRELVREGHAWVYEDYLLDDSLLEEQAAAIAANVGLWHLPEAAAPRRWRTPKGWCGTLDFSDDVKDWKAFTDARK